MALNQKVLLGVLRACMARAFRSGRSDDDDLSAGKELAQIDSLSAILSPEALIAFAVLDRFPITGKKTAGALPPQGLIIVWAISKALSFHEGHEEHEGIEWL